MKMDDLINELFESKEMAKYLIENIDELTKSNIIDIICRAPIDIRRKAEILLELSETEKLQENRIDDDINNDNYKKDFEEQSAENSYFYNYKIAEKGIEHFESKPNDLYSIQVVSHDVLDRTKRRYGSFSIHTTFQSAIKQINDNYDYEKTHWDIENDHSWYEIKKWIPFENGKYKCVINYYFVDDKIMFFSFMDSDRALKNNFDPDCVLNLKTPFKTGDILTVNCKPFFPARNIMILANASKNVCDSLQCLFFEGEDELLRTGSVKRGWIFHALYKPEISPLYRMSKPTTELPEQELILEKIKSFLKADNEKGKKMWLWIYNTKEEKYIKSDKHNIAKSDGITIEEIEKYMEENKED